jgi:hypothetical protein
VVSDVVVVDVVIELALEVGTGLSRIQVEVDLSDGFPETLYKSIFRGTAFTVHKDFDDLRLKIRIPSE